MPQYIDERLQLAGHNLCDETVTLDHGRCRSLAMLPCPHPELPKK